MKGRNDMAELPSELLEHFNEILKENKHLKDENERIKRLDNKVIQLHKDDALKYKKALQEIYDISTFDHDVRFPKEKGYEECIRIARKALKQAENGGINATTSNTSIPTCCECGNKVDLLGHYGFNEPYYWCIDCVNTDY